MSPLGRKAKGLALGLAIGLLGALAVSLPGVSELEEAVDLRWLFQLRGATPPPPEVVVIAIDELSAQKLALPSKPSEWPRSMHARLVDRLAGAGARLVCFDLTFDTPGRPTEDDQQFADAMRRSANVLLVDSLRKETTRLTGDSGKIVGNILIEKIAPPTAALEQAALAHAPFPLPKEARVNTYWTFKTGAGDSPTLPVIAFQVYAFDAYRDFIGLLRKADPRLAIEPPESPRALVASADGGGLIAKLRSAFHGDPQLAARVLRELGNTSDQELAPAKKRLIQSLVSMYRSDEVAYLNFYGPPRSIATIPYYELLGAERTSDDQTKLPGAGDLAGKAVFVGFSAFSQPEQDRIRDDYQTVYSQRSGLDISGVEIAATAFANLTEDRPVRPLSFPWLLGVVVLWGTVLGVCCRMTRPVPAVAVVLILAAGYLWLAVREFAVAGTWLPLLIPLCLQAPLALFGGVAFGYRDARRERRLVKEAFGRFLPDKVVDQLVGSVGHIDSADQLVYGACLATDVEKYTTLAETMSPRELGQLMNEYYAALFKPIERLEGVVSEVVGDAMLAIWAVASEQASVRMRACQAALEGLQALEQFNELIPGGRALVTRFGLHAGQMMLGSIGASRHYEYQAVGDMVNTATRIEGLSKHLGTRILASEATVEGLQGLVTRPVGSFLLAGKTTAVSVVELLSDSQHASPDALALCRKFAAALEAYRERRWRDAVLMFREILAAFPEDGPSQFYLSRCESYVATPPEEPWDPTVRVEKK
jgi:adenylate cyclase